MDSKERKSYRQKRLFALLTEKYGGQQVSLAKAADIPTTLVSRYVNGTKGIGENMVSKIEGNTGYFGWFDSPQENLHSDSFTSRLESKSLNGVIFYLLDVEAECGEGKQNKDYPDVVYAINLSESEARERIGSLNKTGSIKIIIATGDSMIPTIRPHDLLFVDTAVVEYHGEGPYLLFRKYDGLVCKRLSMIGKILTVSSDNLHAGNSWAWGERHEEDKIIGRVLAALPIAFKQFY